MRVAFVADSHFFEESRFAECIRIHEWIAEDLARRKVDLIIHTGDVYEKKSTPRERQEVARMAQAFARTAPFVVVRGNHDAIDDLPLLERLETLHPIHVYERVGVLRVVTKSGDVVVQMMGWPQRGHLHTLLTATGNVSKESTELAAGDALRAVLRGLGEFRDDDDTPRIFAGHVMVRGSRVSTGQPLVGCDFEIGLEDLGLARADFYGLGHIHMENAWDIDGAPAVYPGSPRRTSFGELEKKGYVIAEFEGRKCTGWERIETPCTEMVHLNADWAAGTLIGYEHLHDQVKAAILNGAEVRLRYRVPSEHRAAAAIEAQAVASAIRDAGAAHVQVEEQVIAETRSRTPEVARALTLADKLSSFWTAKAYDPGARREPMLAKLGELEEEVRRAA